MFPKINPLSTQAWNDLEEHAAVMKYMHIKQLVASDPERFKKYA